MEKKTPPRKAPEASPGSRWAALAVVRFLAVFCGIVPQRMKTFFPSRRDDGSLDLLAAFVSRREIRE